MRVMNTDPNPSGAKPATAARSSACASKRDREACHAVNSTLLSPNSATIRRLPPSAAT
jgi:hypothetical protein